MLPGKEIALDAFMCQHGKNDMSTCQFNFLFKVQDCRNTGWLMTWLRKRMTLSVVPTFVMKPKM